ncbi:hypothetical protein Tco_0726948 [Tanacetum coccineum]|uniref:Reverse transcriptase domain-containing protein n=1 Tax=Tanacetum coccineum TaxID=301880 RepID=A0ABQ4YJI0_9ASTR
MEPEDSLIIGDEHLSTILEKESDEVIKSSVEDLVPIPSESEDTSDSDKECDFPFCDNSMTFSNPLFDANDDFTSNDDESLPEENINAFLDMDISTDIEIGYHDSKGDIIYLESLLIKDTISNLPPEVFLDRDPRSLEDEPNKDDLKNIVKAFDLGILEIIFSPTYVKLPFEDRHYLSLAYVIRIFLPYFTYLVDSSLPRSSGSEDIIFDPDIFAYSFYFLEPVAYESPMEVCSSTCFVPNITMI